MGSNLQGFGERRAARVAQVLDCLIKQLAGACAIIVALLAITPAAFSQSSPGRSTPLITRTIDENRTFVLTGNTRPEARNPGNDMGRVSENMPMRHVRLQLRRPAEQEQALQALIQQLHDPQSPNYHHWLSAAEIGAQFGPAPSDIASITAWLQQRGFTVNTVLPSGMLIDFSGTAGQIRTAFRTEIHSLNVNGALRFANTADPQIPEALAGVVAGVVALNDIPPRHYHKPKSQFTVGTGEFALVPSDLATIYGFNSVFASGNTGQGQSIYLVEDTDLFTNSDWTTFRSTFGLAGFTSGSLSTIHPGNCADPGVNGDDGEAILDAEYASAAAPSAAIVMASCTDILVAVQNLIDSANPPAIMSISYGNCEASNGSATNAAFNAIYQQGVVEGASIYVSAGDGDAAGCDDFDTATAASDGIAINGFASTPFNVAVGGTDFSDVFSHATGTYWNSGNTATFGSAKSYVPEIPWNDSCGSQLIASFQGFSTTYGSTGLCNSTLAKNNGLQNITGGSGGASKVYAKPSWQSLVGNPSDGVRDIPDVSLFAGNGVWGHYYVYCYSDAANGGAPCTGSPSGWSGAGGTSFASPIWAGIQALINRNAGGKQGLPNMRLYQLAAAEYGAAGSSACNSSNGNAVASSCIFYDVTLGDDDADCKTGSPNCFRPSGTLGVLSTSTTSYAPAFTTQTGWDFPTGIGTVNVANLISNWSGTIPVGGPTSPSLLTEAHDFNGDTKSDVLWRDKSGNAGIWLMNGSSILQTSVLGNVPLNWSVVGQRDFAGSGDSGILWRDTAGDVGIWLMKGVQITSTKILGNVGSNWSIVGTGDFNGDGKGDVLWRDNAGNIGIWFMNGSTIVQTATVGNMPTTWIVTGADMKGDIFWRNTTTGDVVIWVVSGTQVIKSTDLGAVALTWTIAGIGDFDGNGSEDILWHDNTGNIGIWLMSGTAITSSAVIGSMSGTFSIAETGDFNGDGKSDILWTDSLGNVAIWFMNGTLVSSTTAYGSVGTSWTAQSLNAD